MPVIIHDPDKLFTIEFSTKDETIQVTFRQLTYAERQKISHEVTLVKEGATITDYGRSCYLNIKYALKEITGVTRADGSTYKLEFDKDGSIKDSCVEALLSSEVSSGLLIIARNLSLGGIPTEIINPLTEVPLEHIKVLPEAVKKK